ncbi:TetR family transcriptional regulator OS=Streptomyces microflavus OX=1919 GN=Smic_81510 PE=4 SV=1 [Streptomyces microflavus]
MAVTTGFEVLGRYNSEWLSARTLTGFWRLLLPRLATQETLALLDPSGTAAATEVVAAGRAERGTYEVGVAAPG